MPTAKAFTDLGITGAALFILIYLINKIFNYLEMRGAADDSSKGNSFDRLCDKLDTLVESNYSMAQKLAEVLLCSNKDQTELKDRLDMQHDILLDVQKKVIRIEDRTYKCLNDPEERK